jgi:hypothetical protein
MVADLETPRDEFYGVLIRVVTEEGRTVVRDIARQDRSNGFTHVFRSFRALNSSTESSLCWMKDDYLRCIAHPYLFQHRRGEGIPHSYQPRYSLANIDQDQKLLKQRK